MPLTIRSTRSGSTARLRSATCTERISLSRSKGTRRPLFLVTDQLAELHALEGGEAPAAIRADAPPADRRCCPRTAASPSPGCRGCRNRGSAWLTSALRLRPSSDRSGSGRSAPSPCASPTPRPAAPPPSGDCATASSTSAIRWPTCRNSATPKPRVVAGRRAEADARGDERLLRIVGNAVLVAGEAGADERLLRDVALQALRPEIDQHQVVVGAARDDVEADALAASRRAPAHCRRRCWHRP